MEAASTALIAYDKAHGIPQPITWLPVPQGLQKKLAADMAVSSGHHARNHTLSEQPVPAQPVCLPAFHILFFSLFRSLYADQARRAVQDAQVHNQMVAMMEAGCFDELS
jgi:hypothetical protein